jgi:hypothetical protein
MKKSTQPRFLYDGFGFPVILVNVPMIKVRDVWTPDIDYNVLAKRILEEMATHPSRLNGNEVRFVRHYFRMTLNEFAKRFGVTHPAVLKWEKAGIKPANMMWSTEKDLRLFVLDSLGTQPKEFNELYRKLVQPLPAQSHHPLSLTPPFARSRANTGNGSSLNI